MSEKHDEIQRSWVTNRDLQLELKALRSDVKLWVLGAVALNQFLGALNLPTSFTVGAALLGVVGKALVGLVLRG